MKETLAHLQRGKRGGPPLGKRRGGVGEKKSILGLKKNNKGLRPTRVGKAGKKEKKPRAISGKSVPSRVSTQKMCMGKRYDHLNWEGCAHGSANLGEKERQAYT